eukprot:1157549-Pelagomonas_calceolata.AAC.4
MPNKPPNNDPCPLSKKKGRRKREGEAADILSFSPSGTHARTAASICKKAGTEHRQHCSNRITVSLKSYSSAERPRDRKQSTRCSTLHATCQSKHSCACV